MSQQDKDIRVSDAERDAVVRALGEHASVGRLTLDEFEDRSGKALAAKTRGELDALTRDLPDSGAPAGPGAPAPIRRGGARWLVSILGNAIHAGRTRAVGTINAISILGGGEIDLRNAEIEGGELKINAFALLGGPSVFVPDTIEVDRGGVLILGHIGDRGRARKPRPGGPVVKLRAFAVLGGATVYRVPPEMRGRPAHEVAHAAAEREFEDELDRYENASGGPLRLGGPFGPRGALGPRGPLGARGRFGQEPDDE